MRRHSTGGACRPPFRRVRDNRGCPRRWSACPCASTRIPDRRSRPSPVARSTRGCRADGGRRQPVRGVRRAGGRADRGRDRDPPRRARACTPTSASWRCASPSTASTRSPSTTSAARRASATATTASSTCRTSSRPPTWACGPTSRPPRRTCARKPRSRACSRPASAWAAGRRSSPPGFGLGLAGVIGFYGWPTGRLAQRHAGPGRHRRHARGPDPVDLRRRGRGHRSGRPRRLGAGADGGGRRARDDRLRGRAALVLRPQGRRLRGRSRPPRGTRPWASSGRTRRARGELPAPAAGRGAEGARDAGSRRPPTSSRRSRPANASCCGPTRRASTTT